MKPKYVHYGHKSFDKALFKPIKNHALLSKPDGGLWASPIDSEYGWKDWCVSESFRDCNEDDSFIFILATGAKVMILDSVDKLVLVPHVEQEHSVTWQCLDFEKIVELGYDAILYLQSEDHRLYMELYGWDCDSLLVLNPDIVEVD